MMFGKNTKPGEYEIVREAGEDVMYINYRQVDRTPSLEDDPLCMLRTMDNLSQEQSISRITFNQYKNYIYEYDQTQLLLEVANIYGHLIKQKNILGITFIGKDAALRRSNIFYLVFNLMRSDPIGCYVESGRFLREAEIVLKRLIDENEVNDQERYIEALREIENILEKTRMIVLVKNQLAGFTIGDRSLYKNLFKPLITPDFMFTRLMSKLPLDGEELDIYEIGDTEVKIFRLPNQIKNYYHITPPEFKISEDKQELLNLAKIVLEEHKPREEEFLDPDKMRSTFLNIGKDLLNELAITKGYDIPYSEIEKLAEILVRHTVGFGLLEVLLQDEKVQDLVINGPIGQTRVFVTHQDYEDCVTNIIPSHDDSESWATKFRLLSGRPLDEANPVLDTELILPGSRNRVAVVGSPLNPWGLGFAFRRHRDKPWTLPLFMNNKMINALGAGLISFLIDGARTLLIAGTRGSGKTSFLGSCMIDIMRKFRVITVEDTLELPTESMRKLGFNIQPMKVRAALMTGGTEVAADEGIRTSLRMGDSSLIVGEVRSSIRGDEEVVVVEDGIMNRIQIKDLENKDLNNIYVPTVGFDLKVKLSKLTGFVKHPKRKKLLKIKTKTGREVTVTPDHSLFASTKNFEIAPIECQDLKIGAQIVIPSFMPCGFNDLQFINVLNYLPEFRVQNFENDVRKAINVLGWKKATEICNINCGDIYNYFRTNQKTNIPFSSFNSLMNTANLEYNISNLNVRSGTSLSIPANIPLNEDFCKFLGYYVSEGYYSLGKKGGGNVVITNSNPEIMEDILKISKNLFGLIPRKRLVKGLGTSVQHQLSCLPLAKLISKLGCGRICTEKRVPPIVFGLSKNKIAAFLRALYSGDGNFTSSKKAGNCVRYYSTSKKLIEDVSYLLLNFGIVARIKKRKPIDRGKNILWTLEFKDRNMIEIFLSKIGFVRKIPKMVVKSWTHTKVNSVKFDKKILKKHLIKYPRRYRHLFRFLKCSKNYLEKVVLDPACEVSEKLKTFALGDFFLDEIKKVEEIDLDEKEYVYDLSVEPSQNFIGGFGGILLHNTEARALYEAMRIGALANVVAGTIHGDSPYGVYDRVVNDLEVPKTSFKATDIIIICNPIKSSDGLHRWRRVMSITEVRKHWQEDPMAEMGFIDLMKYNPNTDELEPTDALVNGESEILKNIAGNVKEWAGDWDAIWDNILLRANIRKKLVEYANKNEMMGLLEAEFVIKSNDQFHNISRSVKEEVDKLDSKKILFEWEEWLKREISKKRMK